MFCGVVKVSVYKFYTYLVNLFLSVLFFFDAMGNLISLSDY